MVVISCGNKIIEQAKFAIDKPRKKKEDQLLIVASIIVASQEMGTDWENAMLRKLGIDPLSEEVKQKIVNEAVRLVKDR